MSCSVQFNQTVSFLCKNYERKFLIKANPSQQTHSHYWWASLECVCVCVWGWFANVNASAMRDYIELNRKKNKLNSTKEDKWSQAWRAQQIRVNETAMKKALKILANLKRVFIYLLFVLKAQQWLCAGTRCIYSKSQMNNWKRTVKCNSRYIPIFYLSVFVWVFCAYFCLTN